MRSKIVVGPLFGLTLLCCLATGCGSGGPETAEVSGVVTLDGKPVPGATIIFYPENVEGSPSYGGTDANGKYSLMFTRDKSGAMLGKHRVQIDTPKISREEAAEMRAEGQQVPDNNVTIPKKYREPEALTAEVKSGRNQIDFPLTSD